MPFTFDLFDKTLSYDPDIALFYDADVGGSLVDDDELRRGDASSAVASGGGTSDGAKVAAAVVVSLVVIIALVVVLCVLAYRRNERTRRAFDAVSERIRAFSSDESTRTLATKPAVASSSLPSVGVARANTVAADMTSARYNDSSQRAQTTQLTTHALPTTPSTFAIDNEHMQSARYHEDAQYSMRQLPVVPSSASQSQYDVAPQIATTMPLPRVPTPAAAEDRLSALVAATGVAARGSDAAQLHAAARDLLAFVVGQLSDAKPLCVDFGRALHQAKTAMAHGPLPSTTIAELDAATNKLAVDVRTLLSQRGIEK